MSLCHRKLIGFSKCGEKEGPKFAYLRSTLSQEGVDLLTQELNFQSLNISQLSSLEMIYKVLKVILIAYKQC